MSRRRFFASPSAFNLQTVKLASDEARHLRDVLRLKSKDEVYVFDGAGREFRCVVASTARDSATLELCEEVSPARPESSLELTLAVALLKSEKFDLLVQKATELGVTCIVPVMTRYADIQLRDRSDANKRLARWRRITLEAAKQCGRARLAEIADPVTFEELIKRDPKEVQLMFSERGGMTLKETLSAIDQPRSVSALVGPEGGWSDEEIENAKESGWKIVTLGGRILRAETAAIAVSVLLQNVYGDLK